MSIWKKFSDLARSNLFELLDKLEDPKKLADQAVLDLEQSKIKAKQLLIKAMAASKIAQQKQEELQKQASVLMARVQNYLEQGLEEQAKETLLKKQQVVILQTQYRDDAAYEEEAILTLNRGLSALDEKIAELKRSGAIKASENALEKEDAFHTWNRMEEKIEQTEYELVALQELMKEMDKKEAQGEPKASFDEHSDPIALENELLAIKKKLNDS